VGRAIDATRRSPRGATARRARGIALLGGSALGVLAGCTGDDATATGPLIVEAGYVDVQLPEDLRLDVTDPTSPAAPTGDETDDETDDGTGDEAGDTTIPLNESDEPASAKLLKALGVFNACLDDEGVEFIGAPSPDNPATNDPAYVDALSTCAARSNIVQALAEAESENQDLSPEEIEERNESYLLWRDCMIDRGWNIPEPVPDAEGRLFSFGGGGDGGAQLEPPPGENLLDSEDLAECADEASRELDGP
jgi:hypothetical protein